jgi:tRNA A-37 threonylcarbamoyl transferase component Bud32
MGEFINKKGEIQYEQWENGKLLMKNNKEITEEKINMNDIDYFNEVNTIKYEKYINKKIKEIIDTKSNLVKISARDLSKEMTKENIQKIMNIIKENPDVSNWNNNDVINFFEKINFNKKYIEQLKNINGKELLNIDQNSIQNILGINDKFEINYLLRNIELLKYLKLYKREKIYEDNEEQPNSQEEIENNNKNNNIIDEKLNSMPDIKKNANNNQNKEKKNEINPFEKESLIQELSRKSKYFYSSLNLNGLNYFINFDEIKKDKIKIGEGGFGEIYLGNWQGKKVAIKKLTLKNLRVGDNNLSKFINEINIISSLRHPNIVLYMGASVDKGNYYMISEYLPNGTLFDLLHNNNNTNSNNNNKNNNNYGENINNNSLISTNNNSINNNNNFFNFNNFDNYSKNSFYLNDSNKIKIALQIALVIKYLHSRKIVHCDLKSPNILIDKNYNIKLGDFGLSRFIGKNSENIKGKIGTPHWMAPEILLGGKYEYHSDIFSYGMILWEILTGDIPYNNIDPKKIENLITNEKNIVKVPDYGNLILRKLCKSCINYEPEKRPSIDEILKELKNIYDKDDDDKDFLEYLS